MKKITTALLSLLFLLLLGACSSQEVTKDEEAKTAEATKEETNYDNETVTAEAEEPSLKEQPIEFSPEVLESASEETINEVKNVLNTLGDAPKDTITFNGMYVYEEEKANGIFKMDVFIRNGFDFPVDNLNGDVSVTIQHKNEEGKEVDLEIADANFDLSDVGTVQAGSTKVWTLIFNPEYVLVDNLEEFKFDEYSVSTNIEYSY
jgi:SLAP domain-containing protein